MPITHCAASYLMDVAGAGAVENVCILKLNLLDGWVKD